MHKIISYKTRLFERSEDKDSPHYSSYGTELLFGERFDIHDIKEGWAYGSALKDGYEGWVELSDMRLYAEHCIEREAYISLGEALIYEQPHLKSKVLASLPFAARIDTGAAHEEGYIYVHDVKGWIPKEHVTFLDDIGGLSSRLQYQNIIIEKAMLFLGSPYLYGGCSRRGIDCSALVQLAFQALGIAVPRDSTPQKEFLSHRAINPLLKSVPIEANIKIAEKGDIVFFPGHVGIMYDEHQILHASGHKMKVCIQNAEEVNAHYMEKQGEGVTAIIRLLPLLP